MRGASADQNDLGTSRNSSELPRAAKLVEVDILPPVLAPGRHRVGELRRDLECASRASWGKQLSRVFDDVRVIELQPTVAERLAVVSDCGEAAFERWIDEMKLNVDPAQSKPF